MSEDEASPDLKHQEESPEEEHQEELDEAASEEDPELRDVDTGREAIPSSPPPSPPHSQRASRKVLMASPSQKRRRMLAAAGRKVRKVGKVKHKQSKLPEPLVMLYVKNCRVCAGSSKAMLGICFCQFLTSLDEEMERIGSPIFKCFVSS